MGPREVVIHDVERDVGRVFSTFLVKAFVSHVNIRIHRNDAASNASGGPRRRHPPRVVVSRSRYVVINSAGARGRLGVTALNWYVVCLFRGSAMDKSDWRAATAVPCRGAARTAALLVLACIATSPAHAQDRRPASPSDQNALVRLPVVDEHDIRFLPFSVDDAPRSRIRGITQDDYGFLWLGTNSGLYRYDGYRLEHYRHEPGDPASLTDDRVWTVYKDRTGALWIGTEGGLDRLDATRDDVHTLPSRSCGRPELEPGPGAGRLPGP